MRKTVEYIFFVAALQKQKEHKSETSHKDVTILLVGTGVLDGPLAQDLICRKQIDNPDRFQCLSGLYLICSTNWNLSLCISPPSLFSKTTLQQLHKYSILR